MSSLSLNPASGTERPRVLFVDDEPEIISSLSLHLRRYFQIAPATNYIDALRLLNEEGPFAIILCDQQMPGMTGTQLLAKVRELAPDTVRVLLTGHADLEAAVEAINLGQIFRFLTKPSPPGAVIKALTDSAEQYRLVTAEHVLLRETLHGSIKALIDVMSLTNPVVFGKAHRIRSITLELLGDGVPEADRWSIEMAAMLSQIACATLPPETAEKLYYGSPMKASEKAMVERLPDVTEQLLGHIPRLEGVRAMLRYQYQPGMVQLAAVPESLRPGAKALHIALDFDHLQGQGMPPGAALELLTSRNHHDPAMLQRYRQNRSDNGEEDGIVELPLLKLRVGMVLAQDVRSSTGTLLIPRGYRVNAALCDRINNFPTAVQKAMVLAQVE